MKSYTEVEVSEQRLEDLVRRYADKIEDGLVYVDHQKPVAGGRLDVLMVDSDRSLVVAELKVVQDDGMLVQGLDYYDDVSTHVEALARLYKTHSIDPAQPVRLFLIAPEFSQTLLNRCKWLDLPISLFTFTCLKFQDEDDIIPVFKEREMPPPAGVVEVPQIEDRNHLGYITDLAVRAKAAALLDEVRNWRPGNVTVDPRKWDISIKINNRVFAYWWAARRHQVIETYGADDEWKKYPIKDDGDLANVKSIMRNAMERRAGTTASTAGAGS